MYLVDRQILTYICVIQRFLFFLSMFHLSIFITFINNYTKYRKDEKHFQSHDKLKHSFFFFVQFQSIAFRKINFDFPYFRTDR